jgi:hypothetical protein
MDENRKSRILGILRQLLKNVEGTQEYSQRRDIALESSKTLTKLIAEYETEVNEPDNESRDSDERSEPD